MPHDAHGNLIQAGDKVVIPATVREVYATENGQFCNCDVEFDHPMPPYTEKTRYSALNTQQVEKALSVGIASTEAGEAAYRGYLHSCGGRSLISGAPLPTWEQQSHEIQNAWRAAAAAVDLFAGRTKLQKV
jgi:hypothetical protein